ncbi:MAG: MBL fold metallo-hydrolase [Deltaproteobacteria bacterium]|jgi:glyoxylase-like metal-dependent hydrolase (beta-lactamase superfamily II)|nr:MBL fold metallo-hydrolase [Deltaproteobacteria bacterium]
MQLRDDIFFYPSRNGMDFTGEINSNTILIRGPKHLLIDPGIILRWEELIESIRADGLKPEDIGLVFMTHCHPDHAEAAIKFKAEFKTELALGNLEREFLGGVGRTFYRKEFYQREKAGSRYQVHEYLQPDKSMMSPVFSGPFLYEGRQFRLYATAGHSPGGLSFHWPEAGLLAPGDNFFPGTIGAYDLPGGSLWALSRTISILNGLKDVELVLCGHGRPIEGQRNVRDNFEVLFEEIREKEAYKDAEGC